MKKIKLYLLKTSLKFILLNQLIILFLIIFLNLIEITRVIENDNKNLLSFIYLSILKVPSTINETSPFIIIISTAFLFRYLITNNELISSLKENCKAMGCLRRGLYVTIIYKQNSTKISGDFIGRLVLGGIDADRTA